MGVRGEEVEDVRGIHLLEFSWVYDNEYVEVVLRDGERLRVYVRGVGRYWILAEDGSNKIVINKAAIAYIKRLRAR